ncbi:MAG: hypothetical protein ACI9P5_004532 [Saprospiraceae bacterium]|jgi:hypothetical protein
MAHKWKYVLDIALQHATLRTSIKVAVIVGIILNLINQGDLIIAMNFEAINFSKFIITFFIPFGVSTYSTVTAKLAFRIADTAAVNADLDCTHCGTEHIEITKGAQIPLCSNCKIDTHWQLAN